LLRPLKYLLRAETYALLEGLDPALRSRAERLTEQKCKEFRLGLDIVHDKELESIALDEVHEFVSFRMFRTYGPELIKQRSAAAPPIDDHYGCQSVEGNVPFVGDVLTNVLRAHGIRTNWDVIRHDDGLAEIGGIGPVRAEMLLRWARTTDPHFAELATGGEVPIFSVIRFVDSGESDILRTVARNRYACPELLSDLAAMVPDHQIAVLCGIAENENTPVELLTRLSVHSSVSVREAVAARIGASANPDRRAEAISDADPKGSGSRSSPRTADVASSWRTTSGRAIVAVAVVLMVFIAANGGGLLRNFREPMSDEPASPDATGPAVPMISQDDAAAQLPEDDGTTQSLADSALSAMTAQQQATSQSMPSAVEANVASSSPSDAADSTAASFDCTTVGLTATEALICATPSLRMLDAEMARAYRAQRKANVPITGQLKWLRSREGCLGAERPTEQVTCLVSSYETRIATLRNNDG
jgi:hypothetical protein